MTRTVTSDDIRYDNYGPWLGYDDIYAYYGANVKLRPEYREIGRIPSVECPCRPRECYDAVLFCHVESGDEFWLHVFNPGDEP